MVLTVKNSRGYKIYLIDFNKIIPAYLLAIGMVWASALDFAKSNEILTISLIDFVQSDY